MKRTQKSHLFPILCNWASKSQPKVLLVYCSSVQCAYRKCCMQWAPPRKPHWHCMMGMVRPSQQEELLYLLPWSIWMSVAECWALGEGCHLLGFQSGPVSWCKWGNRTHREWITPSDMSVSHGFWHWIFLFPIVFLLLDSFLNSACRVQHSGEGSCILVLWVLGLSLEFLFYFRQLKTPGQECFANIRPAGNAEQWLVCVPPPCSHLPFKQINRMETPMVLPERMPGQGWHHFLASGGLYLAASCWWCGDSPSLHSALPHLWDKHTWYLCAVLAWSWVLPDIFQPTTHNRMPLRTLHGCFLPAGSTS